MIALEAHFHFIGADNHEHTLSAENFFKNGAKTDKILSHITILRDKNAALVYARVRRSGYVDIPLLSVCLKTAFEKNSLTKTCLEINNSVEFAQRDTKLENFLNQRPIFQELPQEALDHLHEAIYNTRADDYKKYIFRVTLKNALAELIQKKPGILK